MKMKMEMVKMMKMTMNLTMKMRMILIKNITLCARISKQQNLRRITLYPMHPRKPT